MRLLALIAVIGFLLYFINSWLKLRNMKPPTRPDRSTGETEKMVRCATCGSHLPQSSALAYKREYFCNREHLERYLDKDD